MWSGIAKVTSGFIARFLTTSALCMRRQVSISDLGHDDEWRGWYDVQGCGGGECWDYCRWVGTNGSEGDPRLTIGSAHHTSSRWLCVLANESDLDTVWDRWGTVWPTAFYSTRCSSQGEQATRAEVARPEVHEIDRRLMDALTQRAELQQTLWTEMQTCDAEIKRLQEKKVNTTRVAQKDRRLQAMDPTDAPTNAPTAAFTVIDGRCSFDSFGCLLSPNFPYEYFSDDGCTIIVGDVVGKVLQAQNFSTERLFDVLTVNNVEYSGQRGPVGIYPTGFIYWRSDRSVQLNGWKLCLGAFAVTAGSCSVDSVGCLLSPNFPYEYFSNDHCTIMVGGIVGRVLQVQNFKTEDNLDILTVNNEEYSGQNGPVGISPTGFIYWRTDSKVQFNGWKLCLEGPTFRLYPGPAYGRVQMMYSRDETPYPTCGTFFDQNAALVICRQFGFNGLLKFWSNPGPRLSSVLALDCNGNEMQAGDCKLYSPPQCDGVAVVQCENWKLVGDETNPHAGIVYHFSDGLWGTVCSTGWTKKEADVLCHTLRYEVGARSFATYQEGLGVGALPSVGNIECDLGSEETLDLCRSSQSSSVTSCTNSSTIVSVRCEVADKELRLVPGPQRGRLEVYDTTLGKWGSFCSNDSNDSIHGSPAATVACRQLDINFLRGLPVYDFGPNHSVELDAIFVENVNCVGNETNLSTCRSDRWLGSSICELGYSGVYCKARCADGMYFSPTPFGPGRCTTCPPGEFSPLEDHRSTFCIPCMPGTYAANNGASQCLECALGKVAEESGAAECHECRNGTVSVNGFVCIECLPGTFASENQCSACDPGSFASQSGATGCTVCDVGFYESSSGMSSCEMCPAQAPTWTPNSTSLLDCVYYVGFDGPYSCLAGQKCVISLQRYVTHLRPNHHRLGMFKATLGCYYLSEDGTQVSVSNDDDPLYSEDNDTYAYDFNPVNFTNVPITFAFNPLTSPGETYWLCFCANLYNQTCGNTEDWRSTVNIVKVVGPKSVQYNLVRGWTYERIGPLNFGMDADDMLFDSIYLMRDCESEQTVVATDLSPSGQGFWLDNHTRNDSIDFNFGISPLKPDAGKYELCWCRPTPYWNCNFSVGDNTRVWILAVSITVEGVTTGQEFSCSMGQDCQLLVDVDSVGRDEGDRLAIQSSCGMKSMVGGVPGGGIYKRQWPEIVRGNFEVAASLTNYFLLSAAGMYRLCFCRVSFPHACERGVDFPANVGLFLVEGPYVVAPFECKVGASVCVLPSLTGLNLKEGDEIMILAFQEGGDTCLGLSADVSTYNLPSRAIEGTGSDGILTFDFGAIDASAVPGRYRLCWRPRTAAPDAPFQAFIGYIAFNCLEGFYMQQNVSTGQDQCVRCPIGYYCAGSDSTGVAKKVKCPSGATTFDVGQKELSDCVCGVGMVRATSKEGYVTCTACPAGTYQPSVSNRSECLQCPTNRSNVGTTNLSGCLCASGEIDNNNDPNVFDCQPITADTTNKLAQLGATQVTMALPSVEGALEMILRSDASTGDRHLVAQALLGSLAMRYDVMSSAIKVTDIAPHPVPRLLTRRKRLQAGSILILNYSIHMSNEVNAINAIKNGISINDMTADLKTGLPASAWPLSVRETIAMAINTVSLNCSKEFGVGYAFPFGISVSSIQDCSCNMGYELLEVEGKTICTACPLGKYKSTIGHDPCISCGPPSCDSSTSCPDLTTSMVGAVSRWACFCPPGFYSQDPEKPLECVPCGTNHLCLGGSARKQCRQDAFTGDLITASEETDCSCSVRDGSPGRAAGLDCSCVEGYYKYEMSGLSLCQHCPGKGMYCFGGFTDNVSWPGTHVDPISAPGYYMTARDKSTHCIMEVDKDSVCLGGQRYGSSENQCVAGHVGPLCNACDFHYTRDGSVTKGPCRPCSELGDSSTMIISILIDMIVKGAWGMFIGKRSLESLANLLKVDAVTLRIAMQWTAVCSVLKQFKLSEIELYGWSQDKMKAELDSEQAANTTSSDMGGNTGGLFKFPPWFDDVWEKMFAFTGSLPDASIGTTQEYLECLAVRHLMVPNTVGWHAVKYAFPLFFWLAYPLFVCIIVFIWGLTIAKVIYPLWMIFVQRLVKTVKARLIEMGADPELIDKSLTAGKVSKFALKEDVKSLLKEPIALIELAGFEVVSQIIGHKVWNHGGKELLEAKGMNRKDLDYTIHQLLEDSQNSEALQAAKKTQRCLMLEIEKAWGKSELVNLICDLVVLEDDLYHIKLHGDDGKYLLGNLENSTLLQSTMDVCQDGMRWKVEAQHFDDRYWLIKCIRAEAEEQRCVLSVTPEGSGFTFEKDYENNEQLRWMITQQNVGAYTFSVKIGNGEERFLSFDPNSTNVVLSSIPDENALFTLPTTFQVRSENKGDEFDFADEESLFVVDNAERYVIFGILRDGTVKTLPFDLLPFMFITIYSIWDMLTKRYFLGLQATVVYVSDSNIKYRPQYLWNADMRVEVLDYRHMIVAALSLSGLCGISVGSLLGLLLYIRRHKHNLMDPEVFRLVGFFFNGLEPDRYYWELGVKRIDVFLVYIVTYTQFVPEIKAKLIMYIILAGGAWVLHAAATPFDDRLTGLLDRIEYDALRARFFLFAMIQILLVADASALVNVVFALLILGICLQTAVTIAFSWLVEVFSDDPSEESDDVMEQLEETVGRVSRQGIDAVSNRLSGDEDGPNMIKKIFNAIVSVLARMGLFKLIIFIPLLLLRPWLEGRKSASKTVPLFQYRPRDCNQPCSIIVCYHFKEETLLPFYKRFFRSLMKRFYCMSNDPQRKFVADITGKFFDHMITNAGMSVLPGYVFDVVYILPYTIILAQRKKAPPMVITRKDLLKEARYLGMIYKDAVKVHQLFGSYEDEIAAAIKYRKLDVVVNYSNRRHLKFAISAEQINAGLMWLYRQPLAALPPFISEFCELTHGQALTRGDLVAEATGLPVSEDELSLSMSCKEV